MNGTVALDENIADSAGVHIAFQAYRNAANVNESLPNINLSNDQVFFVSFGQVREIMINCVYKSINWCFCRCGAHCILLHILNRVPTLGQ